MLICSTLLNIDIDSHCLIYLLVICQLFSLNVIVVSYNGVEAKNLFLSHKQVLIIQKYYKNDLSYKYMCTGKTLILVHQSVHLSVCLSKTFNLAHYFQIPLTHFCHTLMRSIEHYCYAHHCYGNQFCPNFPI